jgi:hypothetical protein
MHEYAIGVLMSHKKNSEKYLADLISGKVCFGFLIPGETPAMALSKMVGKLEAEISQTKDAIDVLLAR